MIQLAEGYRLTPAGEGPVILRSRNLALPGVVHGFASRIGGVSGGSFSTLNFGLKGGDDPANVERNLRLLAERVGFTADRFSRVRQVHGRRVVEVTGEDDPARVGQIEADAQITNTAGVTLGVLTADCVPVLFADARHRVVAGAHAGWRGVVGGVLQATLELLFGPYGAAPGDLRVAIGPAIRSCCYEVGPEVAAQFEGIPGAVVRCEGGARPHLDLVSAVRHTLAASGVQAKNVADSGLCTHCNPELCFSYRRDGSTSGHHLSVVGLASV